MGKEKEWKGIGDGRRIGREEVKGSERGRSQGCERIGEGALSSGFNR
jgi:hypothetical protein